MIADGCGAYPEESDEVHPGAIVPCFLPAEHDGRHTWEAPRPTLVYALGGGCEPYTIDLGEREYVAWLDRWLTADERLQQVEAFNVWYAKQHRWMVEKKVMVMLPVAVSSWIADRICWRERRRLDGFVKLARERGGEPPGPSWKVRTDWGTSA